MCYCSSVCNHTLCLWQTGEEVEGDELLPLHQDMRQEATAQVNISSKLEAI